MRSFLSSLTPSWLAGYEPGHLTADGLAGFILAILLIPQAMAYALLAGLPPEAGLYTAMIPPLLYALFGQSAFVSVGPVALASLLVADAVGGSDLPPMTAAAIMAIETGAILLALGLVRLGRLVNFISEPALLGFTAAAAVLIATSQVPALLGLDIPRAGDLVAGTQGFLGAGMPHLPTVLLSLCVLAALLIGDRYGAATLWRIGVHPPYRLALAKSIPLLVMIAATLAAVRLGDGIARVAPPSGALPEIGVPLHSLEAWLSLLGPSAVVALIVFVTGTAVAKSLSGRDNKALNTSREAIAVGAANVAAGMTGGYPTGVSLSRSALVYDTGARSPLATAFAGLLVLPVILFGGPVLALLPEAALAALVVSAVFGLIKLDEIRAVWRHSPTEGGVIAVTFLATVLTGVQTGLLIGALAGIAAFLWFSSLPRVTRIGSAQDGEIYRSVDRDDIDVDTLPVLVVRIDRSLYFGNVGHCEDQLSELLAKHPEAKGLLLDMRGVNAVDASGIRMLNRLLSSLKERDLVMGFAALHEPVHEALRKAGPGKTYPCYQTVEEGVEALTLECDGAQP
ncbi:SulP family inorganic anion transporter [Litoreibacter roseus]|uniref:Sodium-independent anion transporter n=1 Tax=Litoreibacter roseus TaxID=2601869 RepID=A0A6N6JF58_9RHOB|nr:SulP family inorganic anion transporter [Litoreibacter roseus]GFE64981.1 sodium-independent anion transporter [Litoreibacter roseus]